MCLGIPGRLTELIAADDASPESRLARVDVAGVRRTINIGLLEDKVLEPGDWVLIHVGFAMSKIDEDEAAVALASLKLMGSGLDDEMEMLRGTAR